MKSSSRSFCFWFLTGTPQKPTGHSIVRCHGQVASGAVILGLSKVTNGNDLTPA